MTGINEFLRIPHDGETTPIKFVPEPFTSRVVHWKHEGQGIKSRWTEASCTVNDCEYCLVGQKPQVRYRGKVLHRGVVKIIDMHFDLYRMVLGMVERHGRTFGDQTFRIGRTPGNPTQRQWILTLGND